MIRIVMKVVVKSDGLLVFVVEIVVKFLEKV